ncbi:MAG: hypothetical protein ABSG14_08135 [Verrucomicrobiia bacterium]|jgi:hypothetical protein
MRISELKRTAQFVQDTVIAPKIPALFNDLISVIGRNAQANPQHPQPQLRQQQPITEQKSALINAIKAIRPERLTLNERHLLKTFIDTDLLADTGVEKINQLFAEHNLDPMGAVNALNVIKSNYDRLASTVTDILKVLDPIDVPQIENDIEEGHAILQITFKERASINSVAEWKAYTNEWWNIIRSFGLLTDTNADQAKILSIQQGSIVIEISALYLLIKAIGSASNKILDLIERLYELRKASREIKQLDLTNKQIEKDLDKEADTFIENNLSQIAQQVIAEINKAKTTDGETNKALQISIKDLFQFLDKGGTVDCRFRLTGQQPPEAKELQAVYAKIRQLEAHVHELKLLTAGKT